MEYRDVQSRDDVACEAIELAKIAIRAEVSVTSTLNQPPTTWPAKS